MRPAALRRNGGACGPTMLHGAVTQRGIVVVATSVLIALLGWLVWRPQGVQWRAAAELGPMGARASAIAVGPRGEAIGVWSREDGPDAIVQAAARTEGGTWQAPVDIATVRPIREPVENEGPDPRVAIGPRGNAVVVWQRPGTGAIVQAAVRPAGASWRKPTDLSASGRGRWADPDVAIDGRDDVIAVWQRLTRRGLTVQSAVRRAGGRWDAPVDVARMAPIGQSPPSVRASQSTHQPSTVHAAIRPAGSPWRAPVAISGSEAVRGSASVATDARGAGVVVWKNEDERSGSVVRAAVRPAGSGWQPPATISPSIRGNWIAGPASLAVNARGDAAVAWATAVGSAAEDADDQPPIFVQATLRTAGGEWQRTVDLAGPIDWGTVAQVGIDGRGAATAIWEDTRLMPHAATSEAQHP